MLASGHRCRPISSTTRESRIASWEDSSCHRAPQKARRPANDAQTGRPHGQTDKTGGRGPAGPARNGRGYAPQRYPQIQYKN